MNRTRALQILEDIATFSKEAGNAQWSREIEQAEKFIENDLHEITKETKASLRRVIVYLIIEEGKHYEESGRPKGHIFEDVLAISRFYDRVCPPKKHDTQ